MAYPSPKCTPDGTAYEKEHVLNTTDRHNSRVTVADQGLIGRRCRNAPTCVVEAVLRRDPVLVSSGSTQVRR